MLYKRFRIFVLVFLIIFSFQVVPAAGQKKLVDKLVHKFLSNDKDSVKKNTFFPFPVASLSPETGLEYGVAALYSFYLNKQDSITRVSTLNAMLTHTTHNQSKVKLVADIWSKENKYHYNAELRYWDFPYGFYGIGPETHSADREYIKEQKIKLAFSAERRIAPHYYTGLQAGFEKFKNRGTEPTGIFSSNPYYAKYGSKRLYVGIGQTYDTRDKVTYTTRGVFGQLQFNYTPDLFGAASYKGWDAAFDGRYFQPLNDQFVLAFNGIYEGVFGDQVPFYLLPQLGGEDHMRGYYQGRFRDKNMAAVQAELRYRIIPRFAVVGFGGAGTVFGQTAFSSSLVKPNYGLGIRYFFDLNKDLSMRIDYGFGEKRPGEKRMSGFYFSMNEAF